MDFCKNPIFVVHITLSTDTYCNTGGLVKTAILSGLKHIFKSILAESFVGNVRYDVKCLFVCLFNISVLLGLAFVILYFFLRSTFQHDFMVLLIVGA